MNKGSPSAETPIASQKPASAAVAKETKLRKRPEDDVPADPAAAAGTDGQLLVAQAAPASAAEGSASAGGAPAAAGQGGAAAAAGAGGSGAAAEGSASGGAGVPG